MKLLHTVTSVLFVLFYCFRSIFPQATKFWQLKSFLWLPVRYTRCPKNLGVKFLYILWKFEIIPTRITQINGLRNYFKFFGTPCMFYTWCTKITRVYCGLSDSLRQPQLEQFEIVWKEKQTPWPQELGRQLLLQWHTWEFGRGCQIRLASLRTWFNSTFSGCPVFNESFAPVFLYQESWKVTPQSHKVR